MDMNPDWFITNQINDHLYLIREHHFFEGNRCNIWLIKGPERDVIIDTGLGVCNLRSYLEKQGLIDRQGSDGRDVVVIITHVHFDHSGGAHHFDKVFIHPGDIDGLRHGKQTQTLNYVKPAHFLEQPRPDFSACRYKVPSTLCSPIQEGEKLGLGGGEHLEILHFPGHSKGSIAIYYPSKEELFTGDVVYECGSGLSLLDWLPTSSVGDYVESATRLCDWLKQHPTVTIYPGHFGVLTAQRAIRLLYEYTEGRESVWCTSMSCFLQYASCVFIGLNCFRCCPC